jgi:hypothetical protein
MLFLLYFLKSPQTADQGERISPYPKAIVSITLTMELARFSPSAAEAFPARTAPDLQKYSSSATASP